MDYNVEHEPWLWAAYVKGGFDAFEGFRKNASQEEFVEDLYRNLANFQFGHVLRTTVDSGPQVPVGLVVSAWRRAILEPHVVWFPWVSPRAKLETAVHFLHEMRKHFWFLIPVKQEDVGFFMRISDYGVIRKIGPADDMPPWNDRMILFHTKVIH